MANSPAQEQLLVDKNQQDQLWEELEKLATEISWGKHPWDFIKEAREDFYLIRKPEKVNTE